MLAFQSSIMFFAAQAFFSSFYTTSAYASAQILSGIIGGVVKIPVAKILNIWGRTEGFLVFFAIYIIGLIILAACPGDSPNTYAGGYTLYWIGYDAVYMILDIFIADTTALRTRGFYWAFSATPFIATAFLGPLAGQAFLTGSTFRWAIGAFAIIQPCIFLPLAVVFKMFQNKAAKQGLFVRQPSGRKWWQSIIHYFYEFDVIGCVLIMAAFILFLLPFSLVTYTNGVGYDSAEFIAMIVIGICLFPVFWAWERYGARVRFMRWELLKDRTVIGACILAAVLYFNFYAWDNTLYSYVLVVYDISIADAGYVLQIWNVGSCFWGVVFGVIVYFTKHFKWFSFFFAVPLYTLGAGLMIYFRGSNQPIGYVIMTLIFIAFGGGTLVIAEQLAVMAAAPRSGVPLMLSLIYAFQAIGGAIGSAVAVSIYNNVWISSVQQALPANEVANATTYFQGGYITQTTFALGSPERNAFDYAWGRTQYYQCIAATAVMVLGFPSVLLWKNYNVDRQQNKGTML